MLYLLAQWLDFEGLFNLVRYQTFRSGATLLTALALGLMIGPKFISMLRVRQGKGQPIRSDGPQTHLAKVGTPTMGGLMILTSLLVSMLLWMDLKSPFVWACLAVTGGFGAIGFLDDYDKVAKRSHKGVSGRVRLLFEFIVAGIAAYLIVGHISTNLYVPFLSDRVIPPPAPSGSSATSSGGSTIRTISAFRTSPGRASWRSCAPGSWARAWPSCGSTRPRRRCSWATPAAWPWAARSARSPSLATTRSCC
jgi:hypothetical protein